MVFENVEVVEFVIKKNKKKKKKKKVVVIVIENLEIFNVIYVIE